MMVAAPGVRPPEEGWVVVTGGSLATGASTPLQETAHWAVRPPAVTVMVACPVVWEVFTLVTRPVESTVATLSSEEVQVTVPAQSKGSRVRTNWWVPPAGRVISPASRDSAVRGVSGSAVDGEEGCWLSSGAWEAELSAAGSWRSWG